MLVALCAGFVALLALPVFVTLAQEVLTRWRYRHIPGPRPRWLTGNLHEVLKDGLLPCTDRWVQQYGPLLGFRLMGRKFILVGDPDAARSVLTKCINHAELANPNMALMTGHLRTMDLYGLLMAKDDFWRSLRNAWQPAFAPASLRGYQSLMDREARALVSRLEARAAAADAPGLQAGAAVEVEMHSEMSRLTLAVVGSAAYGVDFNAPEYGGAGGGTGSGDCTGGCDAQQQQLPQRSAGKAKAAAAAGEEPSLVAACNDWFRSMSPSCRSKWALATALPCALPLLRHLACAVPDAALAKHIRARRVISKTSIGLMEDWRSRRCGGGKGADGPGGICDGGSGGDGRGAAPRPAGGGVAPGSFLGLMLAARDRSSGGRALSDAEIEAQVQTFLLAGFETTANALTFAVYLLALHPDKAEALMAELDEHMPQRSTTGGGGGESELTLETLDKLVYTEAVINEALRLYPPAHATSRVNDRTMKVLGHDIPAGSTLFIPIAHLHRKDSVWPDPEAFRPERFLPAPAAAAAAGAGAGAGGDVAADTAARNAHAHLPFGGGSRLCVGWRFAMQEAKTVLARLCHRLRFELAPGQVPLPLSAGLTLAPKHGVVVRLHRRSTCRA